MDVVAGTISGDPTAPKMEAAVIKRWFADRGDQTLRVTYPLTRESIVLDVGGYEGNWAGQMDELYGCVIHIFEPVPAFAENIAARGFRGGRMCICIGMGCRIRMVGATIHMDNDATSVHKGKGAGIEIELRSAADVFAELGVKEARGRSDQDQYRGV